MEHKRRKTPIQVERTEPHLCDLKLRFKILRMTPFFSSLSESDLVAVNQLFHEKGFEAGEYIYFLEDPAQHLFIIAEGRVKLLRHAVGGKDVLLELLVPGEFFGSLSDQDNSIYPDTAQAQTAVCALTISTEDFRKILKMYPSVAITVMDAISDRLQSAHETIRQLSMQSAEKKISYMLLKLARKLGQPQSVGLLIQTPLARDDLAEMTATTPETASRIISQFQKEGWIATGRQWIAIQDEAALRSLLEEDNL
ncbi:MAG: Crp/Fnr family transcriptional regulator [Anaerolineae bacterium]|nr:Crp/Fnr family transcriptional regulator [Anaerolineae bacterium]